jgi:hypothetical protein
LRREIGLNVRQIGWCIQGIKFEARCRSCLT